METKTDEIAGGTYRLTAVPRSNGTRSVFYEEEIMACREPELVYHH